MNEVEVFRGKGPFEHEYASSLLRESRIRFVTRIPSGIAAPNDHIGPATPFVLLVAEADAPAAAAALEDQVVAIDESFNSGAESVYESRKPPKQKDREAPGRLPPCPWSGRDLALGAGCAVAMSGAFVYFVWRESLTAALSFVVADFVWFGALLLTVLAPIWFFTVRRKGSLKDVFVRSVPPGVILFTFLGAFLYFAADRAVWELVAAVVDVPASYEYWWRTEIAPSGIELTLFALTSVVVGPVGEEVLYRGILLRYLGSLFRPALAVSITALIFAVLHFQPVGIPNRFLFGVVAATLVYATRSLYPALALHMMVNGTYLLVFAAST